MTAKIEEVFKTFEEESRTVMEEWSAVNKELEPLIGAESRPRFEF